MVMGFMEAITLKGSCEVPFLWSNENLIRPSGRTMVEARGVEPLSGKGMSALVRDCPFTWEKEIFEFRQTGLDEHVCS